MIWTQFIASLRIDLIQRLRSHWTWIAVAVMVITVWHSFPVSQANYLSVVALADLPNKGAMPLLYRAEYSSAWIGLCIGYLSSIMISTVGFFLIRGNVARDIETKVWQLLVSTTMPRFSYLLAKWSSHFLILSLLYAICSFVGVLLQYVRAENLDFQWLYFITPYFFFALPTIAVVATFAVLFDIQLELRKSAGSILYLMVWALLFIQLPKFLGSSSMFEYDRWLFDLLGYHSLQTQIAQNLSQVLISQHAHFSTANILFGGLLSTELKTFSLTAWNFPLQAWGVRYVWVLISVLSLFLLSLILERAALRQSKPSIAFDRTSGTKLQVLANILLPLQSTRVGILFSSELQMTLRLRPFWWWLGLSGTWLLQLTADLFPPPPMVSLAAIATAFAWILCLDIFSRSLLRDVELNTLGLILAATPKQRNILFIRIGVLSVFAIAVSLPMLIRGAFYDIHISLNVLLLCAVIVIWSVFLTLFLRSARVFELFLCSAFYGSYQGLEIMNVITLSQPLISYYLLSTSLICFFIPSLWRQWILKEH